MSQNHYSTKRKRRKVSKSRAKQSQKRIAGTMAKLHEHERLSQIGQPDAALLAELAAIADKTDDEIDTSDIPEVKDWSGAEVGKFYRG